MYTGKTVFRSLDHLDALVALLHRAEDHGPTRESPEYGPGTPDSALSFLPLLLTMHVKLPKPYLDPKEPAF